MVLWMVLLLLPPGVLRASPDRQDRQFEAISRLIEKADQALQADHLQEAIQLYGATIAAYREFSGRFPDYRTELVQFRMSYCRNQLMTLLAVKQARENAPPVTVLPADVVRRVEAGAVLCREGQFEDAGVQMRELIAEHPDCAPAYLLLATTMLARGDMEESRRLLERAVGLDEAGSAAAHYNIAQLMVREAAPDFEKAGVHYRRARALGAPADPDLEAVLDL